MNNVKSVSIQSYIPASAKIISSGSGKLRVNPCPICSHNDCFTVYTETNTFHCYSCNNGGSVIDLVMQTNHLDFYEAAKKIANDHNIEFGSENKEKSDKRLIKEQIFNDSAQYYHNVLLKNKERMKYLQETRKRSLEMINKFMYGLADGKLHTFLLKKGYTAQDIIESGLVRTSESRMYDLFKAGFIVYPIFLYNKICDFFVKKGKDSYQIDGPHKLKKVEFYGQEALLKSHFIVVEGQEDKNTVTQISENYNVLATFGNFKPTQIELLINNIADKVVYLAFDNDHQGRKYIDMFADKFSHLCHIFIIEFPPEFKDIDEYLRQIPSSEQQETMDNLIKNAVDVILHKINCLDIPEGINMKTAEGMYIPILKLISKEENQIVREDYIEALAKKLGTNKTKFENAIKSMIRKMRKVDPADEADEDFVGSIVIKRGCRYFHKKEKIDVPISNFKISIKRYVEIGGELYYECIFTNTNGEVSKLHKMSKVDRINKNRFREYCAGIGSYYFSGGEDDLSEIWQLEEKEACIEFRTCYFQRYGFIKEHNLWLFKNCAYQGNKLYTISEKEKDDEVITIEGIGYKSQGVLVHSGDNPSLDISGRPSKAYTDEVIRIMWRMMDAKSEKDPDTFKGFILMGFLASIVYLQEITRKFNLFPYLLVYGEPETGKSECVLKVMNMLGLQNGGENWGETTPAGISMAMEQFSSIPYWIEEFSNPIGASNRNQSKIELLKNIYNRTSSGKGGIEKRQIREVNASLVLTGQDRPENPALLSRCVVIRKEAPNTYNNEAFYQLKIENEFRRLSLVFRYLLENKSKERAKDLVNIIKTWQSAIVKRAQERGFSIKERTTSNIAIFAGSFSLYDFDSKYERAFADWVVDQAIEDLLRKEKEDIVYKFFSDIEAIYSSNEMITVMKKDRSSGRLYLRYTVVYKEWIKLLRKTGMAEYISEGGLLDYLKRAPEGYWIEPSEKEGLHRVYLNGSQYRVIAINIDKLPPKIKQIVETWLEYEHRNVTGGDE